VSAMALATDRRTHRLYETLSRWQWRLRTWQRAPAGEGLELRKRLLPDAAAERFDDWLLAQAMPAPDARVLDVGCGFGGTALRWASQARLICTGVTDSPFQAARAREQARELDLDGRCRFVVQDYGAPLPGPCDVAVAIESLAHAQELDAALARIAAALVPGGTLLVVDDVREGAAADDAAVRELAGRWGVPPLPTAPDFERAIAGAGLRLLHRHDLSARVGVQPAGRRAARARWLRTLRTVLPLPRVRLLCDAFLGGLALEALHARAAARYCVFHAVRPEAS
jgi:SAM-dependent methyltransferase